MVQEMVKGTLLGTPNREAQEYTRYIIGIYLPGSLYSIIFLLYSWGSLFGVPSRVPLMVVSVKGGYHDRAQNAMIPSVSGTPFWGFGIYSACGCLVKIQV